MGKWQLRHNFKRQTLRIHVLFVCVFVFRVTCFTESNHHADDLLFEPRAVTFTRVNGTVSISTNKRLQNQYPCTRSIFNTWSNGVSKRSWRHWTKTIKVESFGYNNNNMISLVCIFSTFQNLLLSSSRRVWKMS